MELTLQRLGHSERGTIGALFIDREFAAFVPEDPPQIEKVKGQTRIPAGRYRVILEYSPKFSANPTYGHDMLTLLDVPGFGGIRIHIGNSPADTMGCILPNYSATFAPGGTVACGSSSPAYRAIYATVAARIEAGEDCWITVRDEDALFPTLVPILGTVA